MTGDAAVTEQPARQPDAELTSLNRLIGTWKVAGGASGTVRYEWLEGGFFLLQRVELEQHGERIKGIEIIGRERPFGATEPSAEIKSRYYDNQGNTFDYVYELAGGMLTIWAERRDSPTFFRGEFSADGNTVTGSWTYPGGGGYQSTMSRVVP